MRKKRTPKPVTVPICTTFLARLIPGLQSPDPCASGTAKLRASAAALMAPLLEGQDFLSSVLYRPALPVTRFPQLPGQGRCDGWEQVNDNAGRYYSPRPLVNPCKRSLLKALPARAAGRPPHFASTL